MFADGINLAETVPSPPKLDKTDCLSRGADDFANSSIAAFNQFREARPNSWQAPPVLGRDLRRRSVTPIR